VSIFSITWGWEDFEAAFDAWQHWATNTDKRLTSEIELKSKEANQIIAQGEFVGSSFKLKELLQPLIDVGCPKKVSIKFHIVKPCNFLTIRAETNPLPEKGQVLFLIKLFRKRQF
jgi:hypothetical protein